MLRSCIPTPKRASPPTICSRGSSLAETIQPSNQFARSTPPLGASDHRALPFRPIAEERDKVHPPERLRTRRPRLPILPEAVRCPRVEPRSRDPPGTKAARVPGKHRHQLHPLQHAQGKQAPHRGQYVSHEAPPAPSGARSCARRSEVHAVVLIRAGASSSISNRPWSR